jgi:hypothetical protein
MSVPTTLGRPWFDTTGTYVELHIQVQDNVNPGDIVTNISVWGASATTRRCLNTMRTSSPDFSVSVASGISLPWDNHNPGSPSWAPWDSDQPYYRICVQLIVRNGATTTQLYKCALWEAVLEGEYPLSPLMDCSGSDDLVLIPRSQIIIPYFYEQSPAKPRRRK